MDHLISMYIDNELSLDEKIHFLKHIYGNRSYTEEAVELLEQEKLLSLSLTIPVPDIELPPHRAGILPIFNRSLGWAVALGLLLLFAFMAGEKFSPQGPRQLVAESTTVLHRFVLHHQAGQLVEISGTFTNWKSVPLVPSGINGYWEVSLELPAGEHRYTFIVDGLNYIPDPTVAAQESDDFGSINSILKVEA